MQYTRWTISGIAPLVVFLRLVRAAQTDAQTAGTGARQGFHREEVKTVKPVRSSRLAGNKKETLLDPFPGDRHETTTHDP